MSCRAIRLKFITVEVIEDCDPALMFTIPRLAIIAGLLIFPDGPLRVEQEPLQVPEMFRHFLRLLSRIKYETGSGSIILNFYNIKLVASVSTNFSYFIVFNH